MKSFRQITRLLGMSLAFLPLLAHAQGQGRQKFTRTDKYVPGQLIVRYKDAVAAPRVGAAAMSAPTTSAMGARVSHQFRKIRNLRVVQLPEGTSVQQGLDQLRADPNVLYAEPDYIMRTDEFVPNDPMFSQLWAMKNTGQSGGTVDADIDATDAWTLTTGSNSIVVGTIDTGLDYIHPDLAANVFNNSSDCNNNGIDDDGNGYIDDCHGWNASYNIGSMFDDVGHGTHVAGTIGASGNNALGVVGVNWHVTIMPCKAFIPDGFGGAIGAVSDEIECLNYFATMKDLGYNIVATNNSWGGGSYSEALYDAIKENMDRGILFIAAAGNGDANGVGLNNDQSPHYPSTYDLANIIAVAATTRTDAKSSFSNYGRRTVDLGAPGSAILSTLPGDTYGIYDGTSMATPHVTGTAALLKAHDPSLTWYQIRNLILAGGDVKSSMANTFTGKRLNAFGSMTCVNRPVSGRLTPDNASSVVGVGDTVFLSYLNINCKDPAGAINVTATPGGTLPLHDDGVGGDYVAGDGAYSAPLNTSAVGSTTVTFPGSDTVTIKTLRQYQSQETPFTYRNITGTNQQLSDELSKAVTTPFPILYGGNSFSTIYVGSNGVISFDKAFNSPFNDSLPVGSAGAFLAPWWQDFQPLPNTNHNVFTATLGAAPNREFVVEWRDVPLWDYYGVDLTQTVKFQVVLFEGSSNVLFNYVDVYFTDYFSYGNQAYYGTVGVQVGPRSGALYSRYQQKLNNGSALLWTLQPDDFAVEVANPAITTFPNQQESFHGLVHSMAAFAGSVDLSCAGANLPTSCTPQPASVVATRDGGHVEMQVSQTSAADKTFNLHGSANGGALQHDVPVTLHVIDYQFGALSTSSVTVAHPSTAGPITFSLSSQNGFSQPVNLSCAGLPAGAACNFWPSSEVIANIPNVTTLSVTTSWNTPASVYPITIQGATAGLVVSHSTNFDLHVNNSSIFTITPPAQGLLLDPGASTLSTFALDAHDGYTGNVVLSCSVVPAGPTCSAGVGSVNAFPATVQVTTTAGTAAGQYSVVLHGDDGTLQQAGSQPLTVKGFSMDPVAPFVAYAGNFRWVNVFFRSYGGYAQPVTVSCDSSALPAVNNCGSGTAFLQYSNYTFVQFFLSVPNTLTQGTYPLHVHAHDALGTVLDQTIQVTIQGLQLAYSSTPTATASPGDTVHIGMDLTPTGGFSSPFYIYCQINCVTNPVGPISPSPGVNHVDVAFSIPGSTFGQSLLTFTPGVSVAQCCGFFSFSSPVTINLRDFSISSPSTSAISVAGGTAQVTIDTGAYNGFSYPITVNCPTGLSLGITCQASGNPVTPGNSAVLTFTSPVNPEVAGGYTGVATATTPDATIQHNFNVFIAFENLSLGMNPTVLSLVAGQSGPVTLSRTSFGWRGPAGLACGTVPAGTSCGFSDNPMPAFGQSMLTVNTSASTPAADFQLPVIARNPGGNKATTLAVHVTDFALSSTTPHGAVNPGTSFTIPLVTKALNGFAFPVALSCAGLPAGATCSFSSNNFTPTAAGTSTTITVATTLAVPGGVYPFTVNATSQGQTRTLNATLTVKDFHFASIPTSRSVGMVPSGQTDHTTYSLSAFADNGFSSSVALSCMTPLPTGVTCAFSPSSLAPSALGTASTLAVAVSSTTPAGNYTLNVKGVSGSITRQLPLTLNTGGPNFTQAVTPASVNAVRGNGANYTVVYTALGGMTDPIAVGCSSPAAGMTCSATPDTVTPGVTPGNQSLVTFNTSGSTPATNAMVAITGSALGIVRSSTVTLAVKDLSLTSTVVGDLSINAGASAMRGIQVKSLNGLTGTVALSCSIDGAPTGVTCTVPASATPSSTGTTINATIATTSSAPAGGYFVTVSGANGGQVRQYQFTAQVRDYQIFNDAQVSIGNIPAGQTDIVLNAFILTALNGYNSSVSLSCVAPIPTGVTCSFNPVSLVPGPGAPSPLTHSSLILKVSPTTPNGSYPITVHLASGAFVKTRSFTLSVGGPNFIPTITPATAASLVGTPALYTVTFLTAGGMNTPIDVSCQSGLGLACSATPPQVTPGVTPGNQSVITITGTPGTTPLTNQLVFIGGHSSDLNRTRTVGATYTPRDFAFSTLTPTRVVNAGSPIGTDVTAKALNGFSGVVTLGCSIDDAPTGMTCTLPASVSPTSTGSSFHISVKTSDSTPPGTYTIHVNGSNSGQTRSITYTVDVRDFSLDVSPTAQTIAGTGAGSTTFALTLTALNGFASTVSLSCAAPIPTGLTCSFSPSSLVPSGAGSNSTLTVSVTATNTHGDHPVIVRAVSGTLVRQQTVTVTHGP